MRKYDLRQNVNLFPCVCPYLLMNTLFVYICHPVGWRLCKHDRRTNYTNRTCHCQDGWKCMFSLHQWVSHFRSTVHLATLQWVCVQQLRGECTHRLLSNETNQLLLVGSHSSSVSWTLSSPGGEDNTDEHCSFPTHTCFTVWPLCEHHCHGLLLSHPGWLSALKTFSFHSVE